MNRLTRPAAAAILLLSVAVTATAQSDVAFPVQVYVQRRAALEQKLGADARNAVVVVPGRSLIGRYDHVKQEPNFWYLTGVESPYAILVIVPGTPNSLGRTALFLPEKYQFAGGQYPMLDEGFRRAVWNQPVRRLAPGPEASIATGVAETYPVDQFAEKLRELARGRTVVYLPFDATQQYAPPGMAAPLTHEQQFARAVAELLPGREARDVAPIIRRMRLVKDAREIAALRRAAEISGQGMVEAMKQIRPGMNDREVAGLMEYHWKRLGSPRASFAPIVGSGEAAMTFFSVRGENYNPVDRVMRAGDLLFVDYGAAEYQTYTADLCRTWPVSGKFTPEQRKYYEIVLEAQEAAIAAIKPGVMMLDVIKASAQVFRKHGLEAYEDIARMGEDKVWGIMPSPTHYLMRDAGIVRYSPLGMGVRDLGHHIGLEVQDSRDYSMPLEPGMVITIEPKIYIPEKNIAIMIEDMILVTTTGYENLSAATPKRVSDIERIMNRKE